MIYCASEADNYKLYKEFSSSVPNCILDYFNENWHPIYKQWTRFSMRNSNLNNFTNNTLELLNQNIKLIIMFKHNFLDFVDKFFIFLSSRKIERDVKIINLLTKKSFTKVDENLKEYFNILTPYAFDYVKKEYSYLASTMEYPEPSANDNESSHVYKVLFRGMSVEVTANYCTCYKRLSMLLPCRHILFVRNSENLPLFSEDLYSLRWTRIYLFKNTSCLHKNSSRSNTSSFDRENVILKSQPVDKLFKPIFQSISNYLTFRRSFF